MYVPGDIIEIPDSLYNAGFMEIVGVETATKEVVTVAPDTKPAEPEVNLLMTVPQEPKVEDLPPTPEETKLKPRRVKR